MGERHIASTRGHRIVSSSGATPPARSSPPLVCTDADLKAEGLSLAISKGGVPVDGDTYDVRAIIEDGGDPPPVHGQAAGRRSSTARSSATDPAKHRDSPP